eukprot:64760-Lingulodinium_polyedra.AAC.1
MAALDARAVWEECFYQEVQRRLLHLRRAGAPTAGACRAGGAARLRARGLALGAPAPWPGG